MKTTDKTRDIWYDLDNAANIFPAISDDRNTNVFRISCELRENVDKALLQCALDDALKGFRHFQVIMRRGLFWFYLERTPLIPAVGFETERPMRRLFYKNRKELLFTVTYFRRRINLEVFHSVSDGTGAVGLLRAIVYRYIALLHREELPEQLPPLEGQSPPIDRAQDSFSHHYNPEKKRSPFRRRVYTIGGTALPGNSIRIITGTMPTRQFLDFVKSKGVTATAYLAALMICAIYSELMPARSRRRPIGINLPVDLRNHFSSETARNFFNVVDITYNFEGNPADFDAVLMSVSEQLKQKLDTEELLARMNYTTGVQRNIFARIAPLGLKNLVLRTAYNKAEHTTTCALSNLGRITMPEPFDRYIENFSCLLNPTPIHKVKATVNSFGDKFLVNFTSCIAETKVQRYVFRHLASNGMDITITCNGVDDDEIL